MKTTAQEKRRVSEEELRAMSEMGFDEMRGKEVLVLGTMKYESDQPPSERVSHLLATGMNPYFRKTKEGTLVKISFTNNGRSFDDNMVDLLSG